MKTYCEKEFVINTYNVDFRNQAKLSTLFNFMEETATEHAQELKLTSEDMFEKGYFWVLCKAQIEVITLPKLHDSIKVKTWIKGTSRLFFFREYHIFDSHGQIIAKVSTEWVVVEKENKRPQKTEILNFGSDYYCNEAGAVDGSIGKIDYHQGRLVFEKEIRYSDLDVNVHANNAKYMDWILDVFPLKSFMEKHIASIRMSYRQECRQGEKISLYLAQKTKDEFYVEGREKEKGRVFEAVIKWTDFGAL